MLWMLRLLHLDLLKDVELLIVVGQGPGGSIAEQVLPRLLQLGHERLRLGGERRQRRDVANGVVPLALQLSVVHATAIELLDRRRQFRELLRKFGEPELLFADDGLQLHGPLREEGL